MNIKAVVRPGAVDKCLPHPPVRDAGGAAAPHVRRPGHQHRLHGLTQPPDFRMMANWISPGFKVVFLPAQVQPDETTGQDYEQVPRKYDSEDEFEIL